MRLAYAMRRPDFTRLKEEITAEEFRYWIAFERVFGPIGPDRLDKLFGKLSYDVWESQRAKGQPKTVAEYTVCWDRKTREALQRAAAEARIEATFNAI